ncbi:MAG: hypothetical protein AAGB05_18485 [Pseudomonadota bacterium]
MSTVLEKQMKQESQLKADEIRKAIDTALNSKQTKAAVEKLTKSKQWPPTPTRDVLKLYDKTATDTWKKLKSKYSGVEAAITVEAPAKRPPYSKVSVSFKSQWRGGGKLTIQPGVSLADMSERVYGSPIYAADVLKANSKEMNATLKCLPAGFDVTFPRILVPEIHTKPKLSLPKIATQKAIRVALPSISTKIDFQIKAAAPVLIGNCIVKIEVTGTCDLVAKKLNGSLDASFNLKNYESEIKKGFGPIEGGFKMSMFSKPKTFVNVKLANAKLGGITFSSNFNLATGAFSLSLGSSPFIKRINGNEYSGVISFKADITVVPLPSPRIKERIPKHFPQLVKVPEPTVFKVPQIGVKETIIVGLGVAMLVSGGWTVLAGGAALKGATALGGLALAAIVAQGS